jgi:hypothetical protein
MEAFQQELPNRLDLNAIFHLRKNSRSDKYLHVLGLAAQARSHIRRLSNCAVVEPMLEADRSYRGVAAGNSDAETELMASLAPIR